ncbi:DUF222 domain-containing protein, partial [Planotetraspora phitsanulokensis]|uniref:DUF222 domain-containing protein n=1 Tax=Planotetraspora phitsanulokensis TaxID=575192 RepID=UPI0031EED18D
MAEPILVGLADEAGPAEVARAGRFLREILDPGWAEKESEADHGRRFLRVRPTGSGGVEGEFRLPREAGARLRAWLDAYARPKVEGDERSLRVRNADALIALLDSKVTTELLVLVPAESLPDDHPANPANADPANADHPATAADPTNSDQPASDPPDADPANAGLGSASPGSADSADAHRGGGRSADSSRFHARASGAATRTTRTGKVSSGDSAPAGAYDDVGSGDACSAGPGPWSSGDGLGRGDPGGDGGDGGRSGGCGRCGHAPNRAAPGLLLATGQLLPVSDLHRLARTSSLTRMVLDAEGQ